MSRLLRIDARYLFFDLSLVCKILVDRDKAPIHLERHEIRGIAVVLPALEWSIYYGDAFSAFNLQALPCKPKP